MRRACLLIALLSSLTAITHSQDEGRPGHLREAGDFYPLGGLAAAGEVRSGADATSSIVLRAVAAGGPAARAGLKPGDVLVGADGKRFSAKEVEAVGELEAAIEAAEAVRGRDGKGGVLKLEIVDVGGQAAIRGVTVDFLGAHSETCPEKCEKCTAVLWRALGWLKKNQRGDGAFEVGSGGMNGSVVVAAMATMAFGADPKGRFSDQARKSAKFVAANAGKDDGFNRASNGANWNQSNWPLAFAVIALAEHQARTNDNAHAPKMKAHLERLLANQEASGGFAHGPGGPNALGYVELEIVSNLALAAMGMAKSQGVEPDAAKLARALEYVRACTSGGGVAYSTRPGQIGHGDPGRTAGAYWAFRLLKRDEVIVDEMGKFFASGMANLADGHASPVMHIWAGALASSKHGPATMKKYWSIYRPFLMACRADGGAFDVRPNAETRELKSNGDRSVGPGYATAAYAIVMQAGQKRFKLID